MDYKMYLLFVKNNKYTSIYFSTVVVDAHFSYTSRMICVSVRLEKSVKYVVYANKRDPTNDISGIK